MGVLLTIMAILLILEIAVPLTILQMAVIIINDSNIIHIVNGSTIIHSVNGSTVNIVNGSTIIHSVFGSTIIHTANGSTIIHLVWNNYLPRVLVTAVAQPNKSDRPQYVEVRVFAPQYIPVVTTSQSPVAQIGDATAARSIVIT